MPNLYNTDCFTGSNTPSNNGKNVFAPFSFSGGSGGLVTPSSDGDVIVSLKSEKTNDTTTGIVVDDLSFFISPSKTYLVESFILYSTTTALTGFRWRIGSQDNVGPPVVPPPNGLVDWIVGNTHTSSGNNAILTFFTRLDSDYTLSVSSSNTYGVAKGTFLFKTPSAITVPDPRLTFYFCSETAGSLVTVRLGSYLRIREMT
jgi:hypothetical protein